MLVYADNIGPYINIQDDPYHAAKHTFSLSSHKFSLSQTNYDGAGSTDFTLAAGNNVTLADDISNRKITISATYTNTHVANYTMGLVIGMIIMVLIFELIMSIHLVAD